MIRWLIDKYQTARAIARIERMQVERLEESWKKLGDREEDEESSAIDFPMSGISTSAEKESAINFTLQRLSEERNRARWLFYYGPNGRAVVRIFQKYILGKSGYSYKAVGRDAEDESAKKLAEKINLWWSDYADENDWWLTENEIIERAIVDGEVFLRLGLDRDRLPALTFIDPDVVVAQPGAVSSPYGIRFRDGNLNYPEAYYVHNAWIDAKEIYHLKIFARRNMPRGVSMFTACRRLLKLYEDWLDNRAILSKVRTSVALIRKVKSGGTSARELAAKARTSTTTKGGGTTEGYQRLKPGAIVTIPENLDYQFISPQLEAADAQFDGVAMLKGVAAAVSLAYYMVSADSNDQKYAGTLAAESPALQELLWWQTFFAKHIMKAWKRLAILNGFAPDQLRAIKFVITPPSIQSKDPLVAAQSNQIKLANGVTSRRRWAAEDGVDLDDVEKDLEREDLGIPGL